MELLRKNIAEFSDDELINQFQNYRDEYTEEALAFMAEEIKKRGISTGGASNVVDDDNEISPKVVQLDQKDFVGFDHSFNRIDLELAVAILRENNILFYADNPASSNIIPLEGEADRRFTIHVYKNSVEDAHKLLDEHFEKEGNKYQLKTMNMKDRLQSFSFHHLCLSESEASEKVEVEFSGRERETIVHFGERIVKNADSIEKEKDRVIFYFDSIEPLIKRLSNDSGTLFSKTELLTILEILQISCDGNDFPEFMESAISSLINFFIE